MALQARMWQLNSQSRLPPEIVCCICRRSRTINQYSSSQLAKLRRAIYIDDGFNPRNQTVVKCGPCTNSQILELKCHKCGHILEISQFSKNQRVREEPLCQPCMNYQQSLEAGGNVPKLEPSEEEEEDGFDGLHGLLEDSSSTSQGGSSVVRGSETGFSKRALIRRGESVAVSSDEPVKGKRGFDKIKAHRALPTLVEEPTPAPGWTTNTPRVNENAEWKGLSYV